MKLRPLFALLLAIVLLLGGGLGWPSGGLALNLPWGLGAPNERTTRLGDSGPAMTPTTVSFISRQAPLLLSLQVKPDRLLSGQPRRRRQALERLGRGLLAGPWGAGYGAKTGLTYAKDLAPWIGDELSLAMTTRDLDRDASNGEQPGYLLALKTEDVDGAQAALTKLWLNRSPSATPQREGAQGTSILFDDGLATAIVGRRFVLLANAPKVLREALNNAQVTELGLGQTQDFQDSLAGLSLPRSALLYLNLPLARDWFERLGIQLPAAAEQYRAIALGLGLNNQGLLADLGLLAAAAQPMAASVSPGHGPLAYIPEGASLVVSSRDLARDKTLVQPFAPPFSQLRRRLGLGDESLAWVTGDYALAQVGKDWVMVVDRQDSGVPEGLRQLDRLAQTQGYSIDNLNLGSQAVTAWTKLSASLISQGGLQTEVRGIHSQFGNYEVLTSSLATMEAIVGREASGNDRPLQLGDRPLNQRSRSLPQENRGYLYLDWPANRDRLAQLVPLLNVIELGAEPLFSRLESLVVSPYSGSDRVQRAAVLLQLSDAS